MFIAIVDDNLNLDVFIVHSRIKYNINEQFFGIKYKNNTLVLKQTQNVLICSILQQINSLRFVSF